MALWPHLGMEPEQLGEAVAGDWELGEGIKPLALPVSGVGGQVMVMCHRVFLFLMRLISSSLKAVGETVCHTPHSALSTWVPPEPQLLFPLLVRPGGIPPTDKILPD